MAAVAVREFGNEQEFMPCEGQGADVCGVDPELLRAVKQELDEIGAQTPEALLHSALDALAHAGDIMLKQLKDDKTADTYLHAAIDHERWVAIANGYQARRLEILKAQEQAMRRGTADHLAAILQLEARAVDILRSSAA